MKESLYLKEVKLSGYKSIENVQVEFQKGLNIIIGKNAAGKTNFLNFLNKIISLDYKDLNNFQSYLLFQNGKNFSIETNKNIGLDELIKNSNLNSKTESILKISGKKIKDKKDKFLTIGEKLIENRLFYDSNFLCHGIPSDYIFVNQPASWRFEKNKISNDLGKIFNNVNNTYFLRNLALGIVIEVFGLDDFNENSIELLLNSFFSRFKNLSDIVARYSPIKDLRVSDNFNIFIDEDKDSFTLNNLFLEFKVDGQWLPFSNLSDGTKRLFYIISEVYDDYISQNFSPTSCGYFTSKNEISRIILLEEPELGIHPHQFLLLLEFLKNESSNKQIIFTTHSPQALDTIYENELNRIILAHSTNPKVGTKLRHLNEEELMKAKEYIKENFLSDYWLYSDLEN